MTTKKNVNLSASEVLKLANARAEYSRLLALYAQPLAEVDGAFREMQATFAAILKAHGQEANGKVWDIEESGECVRLIPKD